MITNGSYSMNISCRFVTLKRNLPNESQARLVELLLSEKVVTLRQTSPVHTVPFSGSERAYLRMAGLHNRDNVSKAPGCTENVRQLPRHRHDVDNNIMQRQGIEASIPPFHVAGGCIGDASRRDKASCRRFARAFPMVYYQAAWVKRSQHVHISA